MKKNIVAILVPSGLFLANLVIGFIVCSIIENACRAGTASNSLFLILPVVQIAFLVWLLVVLVLTTAIKRSEKVVIAAIAIILALLVCDASYKKYRKYQTRRSSEALLKEKIHTQ